MRSARSRSEVGAVTVAPGGGPVASPTAVAAPTMGDGERRSGHQKWRLRRLEQHRLRALDGLRAVAVLAVMLFHGGVSWIPGGMLGVDIFFVLSGYLITSLLCHEFGRSGTIRFGSFWGRRARRLLPALFVTVIGIAVYTHVLASALDVSAIRNDAIATLLYVANWHFIVSNQGYFALGQSPSPLLHTWSLAIEEQFYLVWPIVALVVLRRFGVRALAATAAVGAVASAVLMGALLHAGYSVDRVYYGSDTRAQALLVGATLAALAAWRGWSPAAERRVAAAQGRSEPEPPSGGAGFDADPDRVDGSGGSGSANDSAPMTRAAIMARTRGAGRTGGTGLTRGTGRTAGAGRTGEAGRTGHREAWARWGLVALGLAGAAVDAWLLRVGGQFGTNPPRWMFFGGFLLVAVATAAIIASVVALPRSGLARVLSLPPMVVIGRISYGLYLYHWPIFLTIDNTHTGLTGGWLLAARFGATFAAAGLSFVLLEEPIRTGRLLPRRRRLVVSGALVTSLAVVAASVAVGTAQAAVAPPAPPSHAKTVVLPPSIHAQLVAAGAFTTNPLHFLILGDSLGLTLSMGLGVDTTKDFGVETFNGATLGCDFDPQTQIHENGATVNASQGCPNWRVTWPATARTDRADVVGILMGRWEELDHYYDGQWTHVGEPLWDNHVTAELVQAAQLLTAGGAKVILFTMPYVDPLTEAPNGSPYPENEPDRVDAYNALVWNVQRQYPGLVTVVDLNKMLDPGGQFVESIGGHQIRTTDRIHIAVWGGLFLQPLVMPTVEQLGLEARSAQFGIASRTAHS